MKLNLGFQIQKQGNAECLNKTILPLSERVLAEVVTQESKCIGA